MKRNKKNHLPAGRWFFYSGKTDEAREITEQTKINISALEFAMMGIVD